MMVGTLFLYNILLIISVLCVVRSNHKYGYMQLAKWRNLYFLFPIVIFVFTFGLRYDVGMDFFNYKDSFELGDNEKFEWLYASVSRILQYLNASFYLFLSILVLVYFCFLYKSLGHIAVIAPYCIFFFFCLGPFTFQLNGIRQAISFAIFLYAIRFIEQRNFFLYLILVILASGIHAFSMILLPCYFLNGISKKEIPFSIIMFCYIFSCLFGENLLGRTVEILLGNSDYLKLAGYGSYLETLGENKMTFNSGIGMKILQFMDILVLFYYPKVWKIFETRFNLYFLLFFIGLLLYNIVGLDLLGNRAIYCFISIRFIVYGYLMYYLLRNIKKNKIHLFIALMIFLLSYMYFIASILGSANGCSPYQNILFV